MAESWDGKDRRKHPRIDLKGEVSGRIHTIASAPVINLSASGALLEVPCVLKPRSTYTLRLAFGSTHYLDLKVRIIRSYVHGFDRNEKGENVIKYRAAVEFLSISDPQRNALEQYVSRLAGHAVRAELKK
jgi:c-di-GMP-binding flagellar brake protein YcgR